MKYNILISIILATRIITYFFEQKIKYMAKEGIKDENKRKFYIDNMEVLSNISLFFTLVLVFFSKNTKFFIWVLLMCKFIIILMIIDVSRMFLFWNREILTDEFIEYSKVVLFVEIICLLILFQVETSENFCLK
jgi:hypothetical protein